MISIIEIFDIINNKYFKIGIIILLIIGVLFSVSSFISNKYFEELEKEYGIERLDNLKGIVELPLDNVFNIALGSQKDETHRGDRIIIVDKYGNIVARGEYKYKVTGNIMGNGYDVVIIRKLLNKRTYKVQNGGLTVNFR